MVASTVPVRLFIVTRLAGLLAMVHSMRFKSHACRWLGLLGFLTVLKQLSDS
jgi:hypothetical protein